ncbi:MAG: hypothetical protein QGH13_06640, partial [Candidatus Thalassarchaeaceae archaeon]|nr:hypothetical protein [Candidatus Thalassarchaeaceae archaeon]
MIVPTMAELQGAVDRESMEGQFSDLAQETVRLSETGLPGDVAKMTIKPHTGDIGWSIRNEGTWYTASLKEDQSLRLNGLNDLDSGFQHRYPNGEVSSLCLTDLRAHSEAVNVHESPALNGTLFLTPMSNLQQPLSATTVKNNGETYRLNTGEIMSFPSSNVNPAITESSNTMRALFIQGISGMTTYAPDSPSPYGVGRSWTIPVPAGDMKFILYGENAFTATMTNNSGIIDSTASITNTTTPSGNSGKIATAIMQSSGITPEVVSISSTADARLIIMRGGTQSMGTTSIMDWTGSTLGTEFLLPAVEEDILIHNPGTESTPVLLNGFYHSVGARDSIRLSLGGNGGWISSNSQIEVHLVEGGSSNSIVEGIDILHPTTTGRTSGTSWANIISGTTDQTTLVFHRLGIDSIISYFDNIEQTDITTFNLNESNHFSSLQWSANDGGRVVIDSVREIGEGATPIRTYISHGTSGMTEIRERGEERCIDFSERITGWVQNDLPWQDVSYMADGGIIDSWKSGDHPAGLRVELRGPTEEGPNSAIAVGWSIPLPRMDYSFSSSVSGLELGWRGGFVGTNHPEFEPQAIITPPS